MQVDPAVTEPVPFTGLAQPSLSLFVSYPLPISLPASLGCQQSSDMCGQALAFPSVLRQQVIQCTARVTVISMPVGLSCEIC